MDKADKHADSRDRKRRKARYGMRVSGRSIKSVILPMLAKRAAKGRRYCRHCGKSIKGELTTTCDDCWYVVPFDRP